MSVFTRYDASSFILYCDYASQTLGRPYYVVTKEFEYYIGEKSDGVTVKIPLGYLTDGASVPNLVNRYIPAWGKYGQAAVVHDYLCEYLTVDVKGKKKTISRATCDKIFFEAMGVLDVPLFRRIVFYSAVRLYSIFVRKDKAYKDPVKMHVEDILNEHYQITGTFNLQ